MYVFGNECYVHHALEILTVLRVSKVTKKTLKVMILRLSMSKTDENFMTRSSGYIRGSQCDVYYKKYTEVSE